MWDRLRARLPRVRAIVRNNPHRTLAGRITTVVVCITAGLLMTVAAFAARGTDLRADRNANLRDLIVSQGHRNEQLRTDVDRLRAETEQMGDGGGPGGHDSRLARVEHGAGLRAVGGPGVRVTLTDAPNDVKPAGVDDDALVVHQQDIQAVVNALWAGGAEAMSIQGQRVIATTGIKCVGNTVVLHGVPYAPPYLIEAIGDAGRMRASLDGNDAVRVYRQYVDAYGLGYSVEDVNQLQLSAFSGSWGIDRARRSR